MSDNASLSERLTERASRLAKLSDSLLPRIKEWEDFLRGLNMGVETRVPFPADFRPELLLAYGRLPQHGWCLYVTEDRRLAIPQRLRDASRETRFHALRLKDALHEALLTSADTLIERLSHD